MGLSTRFTNGFGVAIVSIGIAACTPPVSAPVPTPVSASPAQAPAQTRQAQPRPASSVERGITARQAPPLPPIPLVEGPLVPKVAYPDQGQAIGSRDSNFIFGSVGNGHATLRINGAPVTVAPNGTFLAFIPVPPPTLPQYELIATNGAETARLVVRVVVPSARPDLSLSGRLVVDSSSVSPRGTALSLRDNELVRVSIRAPLNAIAWVTAGGVTRPLVNAGGNTFATDLTAGLLASGGTLRVARGSDTVRFELTKVAPAPSSGTPRDPLPVWVSLGDAKAQADTDADVIGRSTPAGTYKWMFIPGTIAQETGRNGNNIRVRLDSQLEVWVDANNIRSLPANSPAPHRTVGAMAFVPSPEWVDLVMPVNSPPPYLIEQDIDHITLTLYGTQATPDIIKFLGNDSLVRALNWVPETSDRVRITMELTQPPFGYLVLFDARGMVLRLRRPPVVSAAHPLAGLTLTVDPGHPPGGGIGPSGITEPQAVLPIARKVQALLEQRGAHVVITRTTPDAVDLHLRSVIARRANSDALVSIHLNAFGDGTNPYPNAGTSTLYFHPQSEPLARLVQAGMMREMGLRDLGVHYQNIAIGRTTWMPALICEGAFLMIPEQENAVKTAEFQDRYARGVVDGIEAYFRSLARP
ncbi:MAG: N-acetylmuramoyl-L-alanine amidase [Gemmatimonadaceae bacterium]